MSDRPVSSPAFDDLFEELALIRREGITKLRQLELPALIRATRATGLADPDQTVDAPLIEHLLRRSIDELAGGRLGECASLLFGLEPGTRADTPTQLRKDAAERWGVSEARFRRDPQTLILSEIAEACLRLAHEHAERLAHLDLERRLPTTSRLAVAWLERFESYYRIWAPVSGLAGDLTAYRATLLDPDRPYDRPSGTDSADDPGYSQEVQAAGYLTTAMWHYTCFLVEVQRYLNRHGGLWLLSDLRAEEELADAVYRISQHSPNNERDDSFLRGLYSKASGELHHFRQILEWDRIAHATETEWQEWGASCRCNWPVENGRLEAEPYESRRHNDSARVNCQLHLLVAACGEYCALVDDDWRRVADWYGLPQRTP